MPKHEPLLGANFAGPDLHGMEPWHLPSFTKKKTFILFQFLGKRAFL